MDAPTGVAMWNQYLVPLKAKGYSIISPSTTSAPTGIPWMQQWLAGGLQAQPDGLAFHWYGTQYSDFYNYVELFASTFSGYGLWLTEFGCTVSFQFLPIARLEYSSPHPRPFKATAVATLWALPTRPFLISTETLASLLTSPSPLKTK
jgi:hypothetical protein